MCYAGGPYCYKETFVSLQNAKNKLAAKNDELMDAYRELDETGDYEGSETIIDAMKMKRNDLHGRVLRLESRLGGTQEVLEQNHTAYMFNKEDDIAQARYETSLSMRLQQMNQHARRLYVAEAYGMSVNSVDPELVEMRSEKGEEKLYYRGDLVETFQPVGEKKSIFVEAKEAAARSNKKPYIERVTMTTEVQRGQYKKTTGTIVCDGMGTTTFHPDGYGQEVPIVVDSQPSRTLPMSARIQRTNSPHVRGGQLHKKHSAMYEKPAAGLLNKLYHKTEKECPESSSTHKELRARMYNAYDTYRKELMRGTAKQEYLDALKSKAEDYRKHYMELPEAQNHNVKRGIVNMLLAVDSRAVKW